MMKQICLLSLLLFAWSVSSCSDDGQEETPVKHRLIVLFSPNGLGDMGYNDRILQGLQTVRKERSNIETYFYSPETMEEGERIFSEWVSADTDGQPSLFVLSSSDYEDIAAKYLKGRELGEYKDVLLFESNNPQQLPVYHFQISMYGASYLAGVTASRCSALPPLVVLGNSNDAPTHYAADGFMDGYQSQGSTEQVETIALADDWSGYAQAEKTYRNMGEWAQTYGFIYSVAGGSNTGIYRYLREYPEGVYTAGMDTDQSALCSQIVGSMVKHIDVLIETFITQWIDTGVMPTESMYGLESGYVDWVLSPDYEDAFQAFVEEEREYAILKEKEYDKNIE